MKNTKVENEECVSMIIPIYNSQAVLRRCLDTVCKQSYQNLQIILVDDGSTDQSLDICYEYAAKDNRFEVYHIVNGGVSKARNYGLSRVEGEYVSFLDADDAIKLDFIQTMVEQMESDLVDMVVCGYYKEFRETLRLPVERLEACGCYTRLEYMCSTLRDPGHHYYGVVWNKIYRAEIIQSNQLRFREDINLGEDFIFNLNYWMVCNNVKVIRDKFIYYNKSQNHTLSQNHSKKIEDCQCELNNRKHIFKYYVDGFEQLGLYETKREKIYFYWIVFFVRQMHDIKWVYTNWSEEQKSQWKREIAEESLIQESLLIVPRWKQCIYKFHYHMIWLLKRIIKNIGGIR